MDWSETILNIANALLSIATAAAIIDKMIDRHHKRKHRK